MFPPVSSTNGRLNRLAGLIPIACSAIAFAIVIANILAGVPPQADENASAHLWQLLIAAQVPVIILFVLSADWRHPRRPTAILALQALAIAAASLPVWLAGY